MITQRSEDMIRLVSAPNSVLAHIWQQALEQEGVPSQVLGDDLEAGFGDLQGFAAEVWVEAADVDRAEVILRQHQQRSEEAAQFKEKP